MISIKIFQSTLPREERHSAVKSTSCPMLISIHAPTRGATNLLCFLFAKMRFQSTLPREERRSKTSIGYTPFLFQSTLPREERLTTPQDNDEEQVISIHAPTRGATLCSQDGCSPFLYFNPRSHERSDFPHAAERLMLSISIHAPTRGATRGGIDDI